ncbi:MAG TPA: phosphoribosyltransferase family protein [bacterium]|nr:phosphoribosyltransferase family protein [bacterium]
MRFRDRRDAGEHLGRELAALNLGPAIVLAIPRGGVLVAGAMVAAHGWPLDVAIPRKLRAPQNPELAFGAVTGDGTVYIDPALARTLRISDAYLRDEIAAQIGEIERRRVAYRGTGPDPDVHGRTAIVVDDGVATGATVIATVRMLRHALARQVVVAIPVGAADAVRRLEREADRVVCSQRPPSFAAVGEFYQDFRQTTDEEVVDALRRAWARTQVS